MTDDRSLAAVAMRRLPEWNGAAEERLVVLAEALAEENARQNLVSAASLDTVWQRHFLDSAQLLAHVPRETTDWLDLGTGAGFPGIVIAILRPECRVTMVESRARRAEWLGTVSERLGLTHATVEGARLERLATRPFGAISARAFAPLPKLLDLSARFSTKDTIWVLPKGQSARQELNDLTSWRHSFHVKPSLSDPDSGIIVGQLLGRKGKFS